METAVNGVLFIVVFAVYYAGTETVVEWVKNKHWRRPVCRFYFFLGSDGASHGLKNHRCKRKNQNSGHPNRSGRLVLPPL